MPSSFERNEARQRKIVHTRRLHFFFSFTYALISCALISLSVIGLGFKITFQMGILAFTHILTGYLIVTASRAEARASDRERYRAYRASAITVVVLCVISILLTTLYIYNVTYILVVECPRYNYHTPAAASAGVHTFGVNQAAEGDEEEADNKQRHLNRRIPSVEIILTYYSRQDGQQLNRQNVILLNYDNYTRRVRHKQRVGDEWFMRRDDADDSRTVSALARALNRSDTRLGEGYVCRAANTEPFSMLAHEIEEILRERREETHDKKSFYIKVSGTEEETDDEEEFIFLELFARHICRNERAFAIILDFFLGFIILMALATIGLYAYIWAC